MNKRLSVGIHLFASILMLAISDLTDSIITLNHIFLIIFIIAVPLTFLDYKNLFYYDLYLVLSIFLYLFYWFYPLIDLDSLRTHYQDPRLTDSNFYEYIALNVSNNPLQNYNLVNSTWLSQGVITYGSILFYLFGEGYLTIPLFNTILVLFSVKNIQNINFGIKIPKWSYWLCFFPPYVVLNNSILSKEVLSIFGISFFLSGLLNQKNYVVFKSVLILLITRIQLAFITLFFHIRKKYLSLFTIVIIATIFYYNDSVFYEKNYLGVERIIEFNEIAMDRTGSSPLKRKTFDLIGPSNLFNLFFLFPVRSFVWFISPYPVIDLFYFDNDSNNGFKNFKIGLNFLRQLDSIINFFIIPFLLYAFYKNSNSRLIITFIFICITIISTLSFFMGARYKVIFEPFLIFSVLPILFNSKNKKYFWLWTLLNILILLFIHAFT